MASKEVITKDCLSLSCIKSVFVVGLVACLPMWYASHYTKTYCDILKCGAKNAAKKK